MEDPRQKIVDMVKSASGLDDINSKDLEIGIYNWCIDTADNYQIIKNWKNPRFTRMYLEKARSVINNLDNQSYLSNKKLLDRIKEKEFFPHELAYMKPENVFPERWRDAVEKLVKKYETAYENKAIVTTDMFKCGKCKKRECTYFEMQTRASDEGMTIFIRCINCGNSWRQ